MTSTNKDPKEAGKEFIVVWDDQQGVCWPLGWDDDCEGAICANTNQVAAFSNRADARRAIKISERFAALCEAQGKPANDDFLGECRRNIHILPLYSRTK